VIFFDKQGQQRWSYAGGFLKGIDDSVGGDLDHKGNLQVVVSFNGNGGVVLLDIAYQEILADSCLGIASMPGKVGNRLLVGCSGVILEYAPTSASTSAQPMSDTARG
jgi:hypothetical protein